MLFTKMYDEISIAVIESEREIIFDGVTLLIDLLTWEKIKLNI